MQSGGLSSLVFLVVIAVWAAYFIQYWVRRREHLATARSVDQFSESMRVLERRSPLPQTDLSSPQQRSYAVTPARAARPQILVKRAEPSPAVPSTTTRDLSSARDVTAARRNRALILLGALSTAVVALPLVALGLLPILSLLVPVLSIGGALAWARHSARAERAARRAEERPVRQPHAVRQAHPVGQRGPVGRSVAEPMAARATADDPAEAEAGAHPGADADADESTGLERQPTAASPQRSELYDVQAVESADQAARAAATTALREQQAPVSQPAAHRTHPALPLVDEDDIPLTWDPVPVPRPTYTMKSRVTRPAPAAADLVGDADTEYAAYEDAPVRHVAGA